MCDSPTPANARDCRVEVLIVSNDSTRNISPKPVISLSRRGLIASGVPSLPVTPVPPVVSMTSGLGSAIHGDTAALILYISSGTTTFRVRCDSRNAICHTGFFPDLSSASVRVSEIVSTAISKGMKPRFFIVHIQCCSTDDYGP